MNEHVVYWVNGLLLIGYALWSIKYMLIGLAIALVILLRFGRETAETAGLRPLRSGRGSVNTLPPTFWISRLFAVGLWAVGAALAPTDIEGIWSIIMWLALLLALMALPAERDAMQFRHIWLMAIYGCGMLVLRFLMGANLNFSQVTTMLRLQGDSAILATSVRASLLPYTGIIMWAFCPFAYLAALFQRFQAIRGAATATGRPQDVIMNLSNRGEGLQRRPRGSVPISRDDVRS